MSIYAGKTALITGSRGIGEAIVKNLYAKGANVIVVSPSSSCEKLAESVRASNTGAPSSSITAIRADVSNDESAKELTVKVVETVKQLKSQPSAEGKVDFLIMCAGIMPMATLQQVDEKLWNRIFAINVTGPVFLAKELSPHIAEGGRIVFFSTSLTQQSAITPNYLPYVASKGAIEQVVRTMSKDQSLTSRKISTVAVSPGPTATDMFIDGKPQAVLDAIKNQNPFGRFGDPVEISLAMEAVLVEGGGWFNGANLRINGGSIV